MIAFLITAFLTAAPLQQARDSVQYLPPWQEGMLDLHSIATGQGEANFYMFPDGTTMLCDAGDVGELWSGVHWPDASRTPGGWIAEYIRHFSGREDVDYVLLTHFHSDHMGNPEAGRKGIIAVSDAGIRFGKMVDRGYPGYDFPARLRSRPGLVERYIPFVDSLSHEGTRTEGFKVGSRSQFRLRKNPGKYDFEFYNIAGSGRIHTGKKYRTRPMWPDGFDTERYDENVFSCAFTIRYGPFKYYNGGDIGGSSYRMKSPTPRNFESLVAPLAGRVDVLMLDHHGCLESTNPDFLWQLGPDVAVSTCSEAGHPAPEVVDRLLDPLYPGKREIYRTGNFSDGRLGEARLAHIRPYGHIVIRVYDGGKYFRVFVLDPESRDYRVKFVSQMFAGGPDDGILLQ